MLKFLKSSKVKDQAIIGIIICCISLVIGYILLTFISTLENPPLGHTIYILTGTSLIAIGGLGILVILKYLYDSNKKRKRRELKRKKHKIVFLKKNAQRSLKN